MTPSIERLLRAIATACALLLAASPSHAEDDPKPRKPVDRVAAIQMCEDHKLLEALPHLEKLSAADPADRRIREWYAIALASSHLTTPEGKQRDVLIRARALLAELKKDGPLSDLGEVFLEKIPEDGKLAKMSNRKDVDDALREGELAFSKRDFEKAFLAYERAYELDPSNDAAALFAGDTFFARGKMDDACKWFARAASINPNRSATYRYWGDALLKSRKPDEARRKYLQGIVADPYTKSTWNSLGNWARAGKTLLWHPQILPPDPPKGEDRVMKLEDGTSCLAAYDGLRAAWKEVLFRQTHPDEGAYRNSLAEEYDILHRIARGVAGGVKDGTIKEPIAPLANLVKLDEEGLLEAYILLERPDAGIARDYPRYRSEHRDKLMQYLEKYAAPAAEWPKR